MVGRVGKQLLLMRGGGLFLCPYFYLYLGLRFPLPLSSMLPGTKERGGKKAKTRRRIV
jgi:hypothetical protein